MPLQLLVLLLPLVMEDQDLGAASFAENGADHLGVCRLRDRARLTGDGQDFAEFDGIVLARRSLFNLENIARGDAILFPACADDCVHNFSPAAQAWPLFLSSSGCVARQDGIGEPHQEARMRQSAGATAELLKFIGSVV